jgi:hypothetical protein
VQTIVGGRIFRDHQEWPPLVDAFVSSIAAMPFDTESAFGYRQGVDIRTAWLSAEQALTQCGRNAAYEQADEKKSRYNSSDHMRDASDHALLALFVRDQISPVGFTQPHYDTLTAAWSRSVGPVHRDDRTLR